MRCPFSQKSEECNSTANDCCYENCALWIPIDKGDSTHGGNACAFTQGVYHMIELDKSLVCINATLKGIERSIDMS